MNGRARLLRAVRRPARDERGATAVVIAILMSLVLLAVSAFAIDLGMQRAGRRDMQAVADMVALDMGRLIDGRTRAQIEAGGSGISAASQQLTWSVARNTKDTIGSAPTVNAYWVQVAANGTYPSAGGIPVQVASTAVPNGVVVTSGTTMAFAFGGVTGTGSGDVARSAVATSDKSACFSIGSYAARLNTTNSALLNTILGGFLGGSVNLTAVGYTGIADANISLLSLAAQLGFGTVDQLLAANVNAGTLLIAAANILTSQGIANANVLNLIGASLGGATISLGSLISAAAGTGAATTATINAVDLLAGTVFLADGSSAISIPGLALNLPISGTGLTTSLRVIQKPNQRCGFKGTTASTSQVDLSIGGTLVSPGTVLGLPVNGTTAITANVASATGTLTDIICGNETASSPSGEDVAVTSGLVGASAQANLNINASTADSGNVGGLLSGIVSLLNLLGLNKVASIQISGTLGLRVSTADPSTVKTAQIRVPNNPATWDDPVSLGSGDLGLNTLSVTTVTNTLTVTAKNFLGLNISLNVGQISSIVTNLISSITSVVLNPLVTALNNNVLKPLFNLLGISIGGADVFGQKPYCSNPSLVG
ncbi:hypothetical protein F0U44_08215 [Nocardioides humilatus]|uniref:Uncharacterized protein n=1 Tax=Nocardioides humilatus TaxID=2607660 RepID=A0A5B1LE66_9ACTN|nr:hypothetical protein [Nocardioides humilatus]KAA1418488.1 hypothetical protein F0U44_08215 [Nocardioides humilatus]